MIQKSSSQMKCFDHVTELPPDSIAQKERLCVEGIVGENNEKFKYPPLRSKLPNPVKKLILKGN